MVESLGINMQPLGVLAMEVDRAADRVVRSTVPDAWPLESGYGSAGSAVTVETPYVPPIPEADGGRILAVVDHAMPFGQPGPDIRSDSLDFEPPSRPAEVLLSQSLSLDPTREMVGLIKAEDAFQVRATVTRTVEQTAGSIMNLWA